LLGHHRRLSAHEMTSAEQTPTLRTVVIPFTQLQDKDANLSVKIEQGFGPDGLQILSISDVPGYASLRQNLLNLAPSNDPQDDDSMSSWCGWHTDRGSLTGV
ncbi:hypothetical protein Tco_1309028, partial [Tanacetum coccineum]